MFEIPDDEVRQLNTSKVRLCDVQTSIIATYQICISHVHGYTRLWDMYDVPLRTKIGRQKSCSKKIIQFKTPKNLLF